MHTTSARHLTSATVYAILAMVGGIFYREWTKFLGFTGQSTLSVVHTHYFLLGMVFFILLALLENAFPFTAHKRVRGWLTLYHIGLNITVCGLVLRGLAQTQGATLSRGLDGALSGVSGIGHALLGVSLVLVLLAVRKQTVKG